MKANQKPSVRLELDDLRQRLQEAEETLDAIRSGEVDALVVSGPSGEKVFTLEGAEHPYRVLVESMNEGAVSLSDERTILYCNSAFARMVGTPLDRMMGSDVCEYVPAEDRDTLGKLIRQGLHRSVRAEVILLPRSGDPLPTQFSLNPVDLEGKPSIGVVVTDLSQRKRQEEAEAAVRMRDEFLAIASHELRTPLSTLVLRLGLLERHAQAGDLDQVKTSVNRAKDQTERMRRLVDRLLDVSQLASGRLQLELEHGDLAEVVKEAAERFSEDASNSKSELHLTAQKGITARVDRFRLDEAIGNVISNAIKYGAGKPVAIELTANDGKATLVVQDRGIGIPVEDLSRIFGRFVRTKITHNYGGLGLGLYIARQVIEQHNGSIRAESRSGGGARIVIELPLDKDTDEERKV
ncbi:MAG: PAS domain-containing sensor histidine kinase [Candidatus Binatus sp.]|uniref:PAS domain-containing sensor histidine kinase n=1 Tax=Candidatus Binatus sp. TaxID=2811406 RepID=UPI003C78525B